MELKLLRQEIILSGVDGEAYRDSDLSSVRTTQACQLLDLGRICNACFPESS